MIKPPENWNSWLPWDVTLFLGGIVGAGIAVAALAAIAAGAALFWFLG